jgi:ssDNA-binding Zn-finger/Zn-ribbon topoisomerase 1
MSIEYITTRELQDSSGQAKGKIRILKLAEESEAAAEYTCPECGFAEKRKEIWKEPFIEGSGTSQKFNVVCKKCGFKIKLMKLKKEAKKKK